jgi:fumarylacetoacetase
MNAPAGPASTIDETHDPSRRSWVASADGHPDFPLQNLPIGVFRPPGGTSRGGIAIGADIFDVGAALDLGLFPGEFHGAARAAAAAPLNALMALGADARIALRRRVSHLLWADAPERRAVEAQAGRLLHRQADSVMELPAAIGNYTDFFAGIHHATAAGRLFRPGADPLQPNYKHMPVAYHGRASSVRVSGIPVRRPAGQRLTAGAAAPSYGPTLALDYEFELGIFIGTGNAPEEPIPISRAAEHIFGFCLLNDWSARDIQRWEAQPLGPFLGKNFATTVSPWIVTPEALAPFRAAQAPRAKGDPRPLPYLWDDGDQQSGALDISLETRLSTAQLRGRRLPPELMSSANAKDLYWTTAQLVTHHTCGGCNLLPGDLFGSGTISGPDPGSGGSLLELARNGQAPLTLASGESVAFLRDGDEVILRASCRRDGFVTIGFGDCSGRIGD